MLIITFVVALVLVAVSRCGCILLVALLIFPCSPGLVAIGNTSVVCALTYMALYGEVVAFHLSFGTWLWTLCIYSLSLFLNIYSF